MLKSNYIKKVQSAGLVMTAGFLVSMTHTGSGGQGPVFSQRRKRQQLGEQPYSINLGTVENPNRVSYQALPTK